MKFSTFFIALVFLSISARPSPAGLPEASPAQVGMDASRLARIETVVGDAIASKSVPGAVVVVGRRGQIVYAKAFGKRSVSPESEPMTRDSVFDMASLTKSVATATSIMILLEQGKLRLDDRLSSLLPEFDNRQKGAITVEQLLRHRSGFIADNAISDFADGPERAWSRLAELGLSYQPGTSYVYSDVGFMTLGRIVQRISGKPLDAFAEEFVFGPLGMADTHFRPTKPGTTPKVPAARVVPTEPASKGGPMLRGEVHDPRARALGGVAGHAGLFSTADDLAVYAQTLVDGGIAPGGGPRLLGTLTVRAMTDPADTPLKERRGLGWDVDTPHSTPRGELFGLDGFGHTGFTGTSLWVDKATGVYVVVLTSRLHPDGTAPSPSALRSKVASIVAASVLDAPLIAPKAEAPKTSSSTVGARPRPTPVRPVSCGIDALAAQNFAPLKGLRVGLVTNHTGKTRDGLATVDALFKAPDVKLVALFSPEHGIRGLLDQENVPNSRDEATGLPVTSLYGKTRKPTQESLKDVDALVYDIQDIGARFYTYVSTLGLVMESAKERGIPLFVLDRPNPIGGLAVAGPVRGKDYASFIAFHDMPVRHGMTVGELAGMFNAERKVGADLRVIPCEGWSRGDLFDRTGLLWVNPSPNMRSPAEALLYPGVGLLEGTNLATGRGTDTPFERVGAPWIDPRKFSEGLNNLGLAGVRAVPLKFTPSERQYKGQECGGVYLTVTDRDAFDPVALGVGMATVLRKLYSTDWKPENLEKFICDRPSYDAIVAGKSGREVEAVWRSGLADFVKRRSLYLLYR